MHSRWCHYRRVGVYGWWKTGRLTDWGVRSKSGGMHQGRSKNRDSLDGAAEGFAIACDDDTGSRREWFRKRVGAVAYDAAGEAAIILDGRGEVGDQKAAFIEMKRRWAVVTTGEWVVENNGVYFFVSTLCNSV